MLTKQDDEYFLFTDGSFQDFPNHCGDKSATVIKKLDYQPQVGVAERTIETQWRDTELSKVLNRIDQYEKDQNYPVELRTSPFTAEQYTQLLQDRKLLSDYPSVENFPLVERPVLSGLV